MKRDKNQYPEFQTKGYQAVKKERPVIKSVIKAESGMVLVFDKAGEQIPEYQGQYQKVKPSIIKDAPPSTVFNHALQLHGKIELKIVSREEW